jgi:segregation and condensation protein A
MEQAEFESPTGERSQYEPALVVDVAGFEGPLDLLLTLARNQQVDLKHISILALAEQYLQFIETARDLKMEIAADYLVMAAWLAYLKSRLLLPEPPQADEPSAADLAADLQARLRHLEAIREAGNQLISRHRLGHDFFVRGMPEVRHVSPSGYTATLYDLLSAYAIQRQREALTKVKMPERKVWSLPEARAAIERLIGKAADWTRLDQYLIAYVVEPEMRKTVLASSFSATLEMVKEGKVELQQKSPFEPIWLRRREGSPEPSASNTNTGNGERPQ